ncbi:MAG: histidine kinase [Crocinitomicaceae bacterium]
MERKALFYWLAQIIGWGAYYGLSVALLYSTKDFSYSPNLIYYALSSMIVSVFLSHGIRFLVLKFDLLNRKLTELILWTVLMSIVAAFLLEFFQYYYTTYLIEVDFVVEAVEEDDSIQWANFLFATSRSLILFLLWSGFYFAVIFIEKARKQEIMSLKWDVSKNEIELKNLRAQLNPHFLFNSLNSIRALVGINPEQAKLAITHLSVLLRQSISLGKHKLVKLSEEMELVGNYLELEKIRFEERLKIKYEIDEEALNCEIPPLMVQTIVENSIKHGIAMEIEGGEIVLGAYVKDNELIIKVSNPGSLSDSLGENGVGISNTRKRLSILFGEKGTFDIYEKDGTVHATIKIDYK